MPGRTSVQQSAATWRAQDQRAPYDAQHHSELAALRKAGYDPSPWYDPYYPDDLQAAQRLVDYCSKRSASSLNPAEKPR
jgi:hypothetical protein